LHLFSERARTFLSSAARREVERDPQVIAAKLRTAERPVWPSVVEFERTYGGLVWKVGDDRDELGIYYEPCDNFEDENEVNLVPIGGEGPCTIYMNEAGEVDGYWKSSSIVTHIEGRAFIQIRDWSSQLHVEVRPPPGERLAEGLGLRLVKEASDAYHQYWEGDGVKMRHLSQAGAVEAEFDVVFTTSVEVVVRVLELSGEGARFSIGGRCEQRRLTPEEWAAIPAPESWSDAPGARRYAYEDSSSKGVIWVLGEPGDRRIEEIAMRGNTVHAWTTYRAGGAIRR